MGPSAGGVSTVLASWVRASRVLCSKAFGPKVSLTAHGNAVGVRACAWGRRLPSADPCNEAPSASIDTSQEAQRRDQLSSVTAGDEVSNIGEGVEQGSARENGVVMRRLRVVLIGFA